MDWPCSVPFNSGTYFSTVSSMESIQFESKHIPNNNDVTDLVNQQITIQHGDILHAPPIKIQHHKQAL